MKTSEQNVLEHLVDALQGGKAPGSDVPIVGMESNEGFHIHHSVFEALIFKPAKYDPETTLMEYYPCHVHFEELGGNMKAGWVYGIGACQQKNGGDSVPCFLFAKMNNHGAGDTRWKIAIPFHLLHLFAVGGNEKFIDRVTKMAIEANQCLGIEAANFHKIVHAALDEVGFAIYGMMYNLREHLPAASTVFRHDENGRSYAVDVNQLGDVVERR